MKDVRVDPLGRQRCWNCGGLSFTEKRTVRSKVVVGVGAVMTKKKLKCQSCGEFNDVGNAKAYKGPASRRAAKKAGTRAVDEAMEKQLKGTDQHVVVNVVNVVPPQQPVQEPQVSPQPLQQPPAIQPPPAHLPPPLPTALQPHEEVVDAEIIEEPPSPPPPVAPAGWHPDPHGRHEHRYFDGTAWTEHVSTGGVQAIDPA